MPAPIPANRFDVWTIPSYDEWMKGTALGLTKPRSDRLKKIDTALKDYTAAKSDPRLITLRKAFHDWAMWKGPSWATSERNTAAKGALFTRLDKALRSMRTMTKADADALAFQEQQRKQAIVRLFRNKKVTLKGIGQTIASSQLLTQAHAMYHELKIVYDPAAAVASAASPSVLKVAMEAMIAKMFDVQTFSVISGHLMNTFGGDIIAACVPILGHGRSGTLMLKAMTDLALATNRRFSNLDHGYVFHAGDPAEAFKALDRLLLVDIGQKGGTAALTSADFATRSILACLDGGVVTGALTGAATAVAKITKRVYELSLEYKETKAVNLLLDDPAKLGFGLFKAKPLLGAYMLCCSSDWDLIAMAGEDFGQDGWMDDVEAIKKDHITPVRTTAHRFIVSSIYEIKDLTSLATRPTTAAGVIKSIKNKISPPKKKNYGSGGPTSPT